MEIDLIRFYGIDWTKQRFDLVGPGRAAFLAGDGSLHTCDVACLDSVLYFDEDILILAQSPEEWREFLKEQRHIAMLWGRRHILTDSDERMLRAMGICWRKR
jgi:hypothetical protein